MKGIELGIREIVNEDQTFITEMLYQAIHVKEGEEPPPRSVLEEALNRLEKAFG